MTLGGARASIATNGREFISQTTRRRYGSCREPTDFLDIRITSTMADRNTMQDAKQRFSNGVLKQRAISHP